MCRGRRRGVGSGSWGALGGAGLGDVLAIARSDDVDADRVHREAVEDRGGQGGIAEIPAPVAERDIGGDGSRYVAMSTVDEVVERVRGGGLFGAALDLAKTHVVDDQERRTSPALEATSVGAVGETGMEVVDQVDAPGVAHVDPLLAGAQGKGLEDVTLAGAVVAGDHEVVVATDEVEAGELEDEGLVEGRLKIPVERLECLSLDEPTGVDAPGDALLELVGGLDAEDVLEERGGAGALVGGPRKQVIELIERAGQSEEFDVSS
jgi:hypothetical protein